MGSSPALQSNFAANVMIYKMFPLRFLGRGQLCSAVLPHPPLTPPKEGFSLQEHAAAGRRGEGFEVRFSITEQPKQVLSTTKVAKYLCF